MQSLSTAISALNWSDIYKYRAIAGINFDGMRAQGQKLGDQSSVIEMGASLVNIDSAIEQLKINTFQPPDQDVYVTSADFTDRT